MNSLKDITIGFYCLNDPLDKRSWSGIPYYLGRSLERNIGVVDYLGPVKVPWLLEKIMRGIMKFSRNVIKKEYLPQYSLLKNKYAAWYLKQQMKGKRYSFLLAPAAASELAFLETDVPIVYFGDATFKAYSTTYETVFDNVNMLSKLEGEWLEKESLKKSSLYIFTSHWAANSAINDYGVPVDKIEVMLMGANIDDVPDRNVIFKKVENPILTLLFLAVDWERKGGPLAFDTLLWLHKHGIKAKLIVCGCVPPSGYTHPYMEVIPFIDKNLSADYERFVEILSSIHFLILPTRADCSLLVAMEANSYGVPAITTNVGGVPDVVKDDINGYCLPLNAGGEQYANKIMEIFSNKERYHKLVQSSRDRFEQVLNWDKWAEHFKEVLKKHEMDNL